MISVHTVGASDGDEAVDERRWRGGTYHWGLALVIGGVHTEGASDGDEAVDEPTLASSG